MDFGLDLFDDLVDMAAHQAARHGERLRRQRRDLAAPP